jgi:hypothetical protein
MKCGVIEWFKKNPTAASISPVLNDKGHMVGFRAWD